MLDNEHRIPYYIQIKSYLRRLAAEKKPYEGMPSETQLSQMFKVSRGTVKQAVMDLVYEGVLYREQGKGTFVAPGKITRSFERLPSFTNDIRRSGLAVRMRILGLTKVPPTDMLQKLFQLAPQEPLVKLKRLVSTDESPVVLLSSYLNPKIYPSLAAEEIGDSLYEALEKKYGILPVKARDSYTFVDVAPKTADLLGCPKTDCVCYSQRIAYLKDDMAVEYVESFIRRDRFKLDIYIDTQSQPVYTADLGGMDGGETASPYGVDFRPVVL